MIAPKSDRDLLELIRDQKNGLSSLMQALSSLPYYARTALENEGYKHLANKLWAAQDALEAAVNERLETGL